MTALDRALWLVSLGLSVIPVNLNKRPLLAWTPYQHRIATDLELRRWFGRGHEGIGIVTGTISGIVVVDLDSPEALAWAQQSLPRTQARVLTGYKSEARTFRGEHWYFSHPGVPVANRARLNTGNGKLAIDVRGDGGYVIAPGSPHKSGVTYEIL